MGGNNLTLPAGLAAVLYRQPNTRSSTGLHHALLQRSMLVFSVTLRLWSIARQIPGRLGCPGNYSYMTRTGTQAAGFVQINGFMPTNVPAPIDDNTQNFGAKGEYIGTSLWGQKFTFKAAYNGSIYNDNISCFKVQNPLLSSTLVPAHC